MNIDWIGRVTGRVVEDVDTSLDTPPGAPVDEPEQPRQSRADYDEETGQLPVEQIPSETVVNELLAAWNNGQQNEVASQLLFTPVSYADFVKLCFAIGQDSAVQLGLMLDDLAESEGMVTDEPAENRILSRPPERKLAGGPSEAPGPTSAAGQVPPMTAQAADKALPPPPVEEPEPDQPQERNE